jgi:hypothetical protein
MSCDYMCRVNFKQGVHLIKVTRKMKWRILSLVLWSVIEMLSHLLCGFETASWFYYMNEASDRPFSAALHLFCDIK